MASTLVLIRGIPGSGKSTLAKAMPGFFHVIEAPRDVPVHREEIWQRIRDDEEELRDELIGGGA